MKRIATVIVLSLAVAGAASAEESRIGVGLQLGDTTGITAKGALDVDDALQFAFGWRPPSYAWNGPGPTATVDWLHTFAVFGPSSEVVRFGLYAGAGAGLGWSRAGCFRDAFGRRFCDGGSFVGMAARVPTGFSVFFSATPFELYAELTPSIRVVPSPGWLDLSGAVGGRLYF